MTERIKKPHPALQHGGYSATSILPGESAAEFEKLRQGLISELTPNGALQQETVETIAHLAWQKKSSHISNCGACSTAHDTDPECSDPDGLWGAEI